MPSCRPDVRHAVLPAAARLTRSQEFGTVVRRGRRAGRPRLVVHVLVPGPGTVPGSTAENAEAASPTRPETMSPRVGFVVSRSVGNSVVRHRVSRRLRHLMRDRLGALPPGSTMVVRALPPAAAASSRELGTDLDGALRRLRLGPTDRGDAT